MDKLIILIKRYLDLEARFRETESEHYLTRIKDTREQILSEIKRREDEESAKLQTLINF